MADRGDYRATYCTFWDDPHVHALSHLAYRVLTTLKGTLPASGIGVVYLSQLAERCNSDTDSVATALAELERPKGPETYGWIVRERNVVWVVNGLRYEPTLTHANRNHRAFLRDRLIAPLGVKPPIVAAFRRYYAEWFDDSTPIPSETHGDHSPVQSSPALPSEAKEGVIGEPTLTALYVVIWANKAVTERWGEQPAPYTERAGHEMAAALVAAGVEWQTARDSIYRQCRESNQPKPPRGVAYFRNGVLEDWERERTRRNVAANTEPAPPKRVRVRPSELAPIDDTAERQRIGMVVQSRRARADGDEWWARMQAEAKAPNAGALYAYAAQHVDEPGRAA